MGADRSPYGRQFSNRAGAKPFVFAKGVPQYLRCMSSLHQVPRNYDPQTNLYWFRRLDQHPEPGAKSLAEEYCAHLGEEFKIFPPKVFWFDEADYGEAKKAWDNYPEHKSVATDPLKEPYEYFRWSGRKLFFAGYTHGESPLGIMANVCRCGEDLLKTIAHEFFHFCPKEVMETAGWWRPCVDIEQLAREFENSRTDEICAFLIARASGPERFPG